MRVNIIDNQRDCIVTFSDGEKMRLKVVCEAYGQRTPKGQLIEKSDKVFTCEGSDSNSSSWVANMPWRVALKSRELAVYCGQQFLDLWVTYLFS